MEAELQLLRQTLDEALGTAYPVTWEPPEDGEVAAVAWNMAVELGWDQIGLPEELGGLGESVTPLVLLASACGRHRMPIPVVEAALGRWAIAAAGLPQPPEGAVIAIAPGALDDAVSIGDSRANGLIARVPWARHASHLVLSGSSGAIVLIDMPHAGVLVRPGVNLAGEARDELALHEVRVGGAAGATTSDGDRLLSRAALLRSAQIHGALQQTLAATREHTGSRKQFGRPLDRFQFVGGHIAEMAARTALVEAMVADAARAHDAGAPEPATGSVKVVSAEAATTVARSAHQCHGAIGVTREYRLHQFTRRLWAWREEFGGERRCARLLGAAALAGSSADLWGATEPCGRTA